MKKIFFSTFIALTAFFLFTQQPELEARTHRSAHVQVGFRQEAPPSYVARRYVRPVVTPVYVPVDPFARAYVYQMQPQPYVEEVYVQQPVVRPFAGLSFSWNFFK